MTHVIKENVEMSEIDGAGERIDADSLEREIRHVIEHAAHLLPAQGPIEVFVHHNTLHAFEDLPFHKAVREGLRIYGGQPYLREDKFREMISSGRITQDDLGSILDRELGDQSDQSIAGLTTLKDLRLAQLRFPCDAGPDAELRWQVAETEALEEFRDEVPFRIQERTIQSVKRWVEEHEPQLQSSYARFLPEDAGSPKPTWNERHWEAFTLRFLWRVCREKVADLEPHVAKQVESLRPRDILLRATGEDLDRYVNELLVRLCSAFLDQGYSDWSMPDRDQGFYRAFLSIYRHRKSPPDRWMRGLKRDATALWKSQVSPIRSIADSLELLGVPRDRYEEFLTQTLLALPGWAGMMWQMESAAEWTVRPAPKDSLLEYLAVRLILERRAILYLGEQFFGCDRSVSEVIESARKRIPRGDTGSFDRRAFRIFQLAQVIGWTPPQLLERPKKEWEELVREIENFSSIERRRVFQEAFEAHYRSQALDAFAIHSQRRRQLATERSAGKDGTSLQKPSFQIVCCIDDREESFRRHLEEIDPHVETFGAAGFFAVVMYYRGATEAYFKPLCPNVITPQHYVTEEVGYTFEGINQQRAASRQQLGRLTHRVHAGSRTFLGGVFTGLLGSIATVPLVARVLFPRLTARIRSTFGQLLQPPPVTQLQLERYKPEPGPENGHIGFDLNEMADMVQRLLSDIGLTKPEQFSRLFVVCGHGAASLNNPHESAYCCGACAGKRGGPNARAFAQIANDWRVRAALEERGLSIPKDTVFIGCYHDTTNDSVVWFDLDRLPASHRNDFEQTRQITEEARRRNAHERCRRFASAPLDLTPDEALRHVETRGQDLSQVRPEYNHATNALCLVGRREWSRGLFLDRRAFLTSYDPSQDRDGQILARILAAAIPVCAGINLEYYFSTADNKKYGSGSKLPHNLVSMLGVMEGANSDLRTGLYQQMVEIHEPMRLLFVIETTPQVMLGIMESNEAIGRLCRGDWIQLALIDAEKSSIQIWQDGRFVEHELTSSELPIVASSRAWYEKKRDHLGFATIVEPVDRSASSDADREEKVGV